MTDAIQLDALELETRPDPDATVIWLHGLGAHGSDFIDAVPELGLPASAALRFSAPRRTSSSNRYLATSKTAMATMT